MNRKTHPTVVLVDDDKALRNAVTFSLETEGYRVRAFANAQSLLSDGDRSADCYVIDEVLSGGMRGLALLAELRAGGMTAPAILITTHPSVELRRRAEKLGTPIVEKPLIGPALALAVENALAR